MSNKEIYNEDIKTQRRFWSKVYPSEKYYNGTHCIEWLAGHSREGYGHFKIKNKKSTTLAHRYSYYLFNGSFDENICVLHYCDNPKCVNPLHLFLGTRQQNNKDKQNKNRAPFGESNYWAKLTKKQVEEIRSLYKPRDPINNGRALAKKYGIGKSTVMNIIHRVKWNKN